VGRSVGKTVVVTWAEARAAKAMRMVA
jgi:hypothetical protein